MVPTSLKGEPTAQERGPLGGCLLMLASQYAVFVSPLWGPLVGTGWAEPIGEAMPQQRPSTGEVQEFFSRAQKTDLRQSRLLDTLGGVVSFTLT